MSGNGNGVWKWVATVLIGLVVGGGSGLFAAANKPSKDEVSKMIQTEAPYKEDRKVIQRGIEANTKAIEKNREKIDGVQQGINEILRRLPRE